MYPPSSSAPKGGLWGRRQNSQGPAGLKGSPPKAPPTPSLLSLPTFGAGGGRQRRIWVREPEASYPHRTSTCSKGFQGRVVTPCTLDRVKNPWGQQPPGPSCASEQLPHPPLPAPSLGAEPHWHANDIHTHTYRATRGAGEPRPLALPNSRQSVGNRPPLPHHQPHQTQGLLDSILLLLYQFGARES